MKRIIGMLLCLVSFTAAAQVGQIDKTYPFTGQELDLEVALGSKISITAWDKPEISVKVVYKINGGKDNEALKVDLDDYNDRLAIDIDLNERRLDRSEYCCCEEDNGIYMNGNKRKSSCLELFVEIMAPTEANVRIETVIADAILKGMSGNIEIESVTGMIDIAWVESHGATVNMKSVNGDLYTNLDLKSKTKDGLRQISGHNVNGLYKDGQRRVKLETVTSDIYFTKPK